MGFKQHHEENGLENGRYPVEDSEPPMKTMVSLANKHTTTDWIAFKTLLAVSGANIFVLFTIPKFQQIFNDMYGTKPLPPSTSVLLHWKFLFVLVAFVWPFIGVLVLYVSPVNNTMGFVWSLVLVALVQTGFTTIVLFLPLIVMALDQKIYGKPYATCSSGANCPNIGSKKSWNAFVWT